MGFFDSVKKAVGMGDEEQKSAGDLAAEFEEELEQEQEFEDELAGDDEEEDIHEEWDSAYQFSHDMIEPHGFATMKDFGIKFMYYEVSRSPRYRDRLKQGADTIEMVTESMERLEGVRGSGEGEDFGEIASELEEADRAIKAAESLSGKDDQMTQQLIQLGNRAVQSLGTAAVQTAGGTDSSVSRHDEEI